METKKEYTDAEIAALVQSAIDARRWKLSNLAKYKGYIVFVWLVLLTLLVLTLLFRQAPSPVLTAGRTAELSVWTAQQAKLIPSAFQTDVKTIFRESYQETVQKIRNGQITATADARLQVSQLIQSKIRALNRNPADEKKLLQACLPLSNAIGDRLSEDVESGKIRDHPAEIANVFTAITQGLK